MESARQSSLRVFISARGFWILRLRDLGCEFTFLWASLRPSRIPQSLTMASNPLVVLLPQASEPTSIAEVVQAYFPMTAWIADGISFRYENELYRCTMSIRR